MIYQIAGQSISGICDANALKALEQGSLILLPQLPFQLLPEEKKIFDYPWQESKAKNISFDKEKNFLKAIQVEHSVQNLLKPMLTRYANFAEQLLGTLLPSYQNALMLKRTSFRAIEIKGRKSPSYRKDDTRLHVDAFPANPTGGLRLLRVFSNINPEQQPRVWRLGEAFPDLVQRFALRLKKPCLVKKYLLKTLHITKTLRTDYDDLMLQLHDQMKADIHYQQNVPQKTIELPAGATWIVFTDVTSHAALAGQYCLEQTFTLPVEAMQNPELSPFKILQKHFAI